MRFEPCRCAVYDRNVTEYRVELLRKSPEWVGVGTVVGMNAFQRTQARLLGQPVDHLPAQPLFMIYAADLIGCTYREYVSDHRWLVRGQLAVAERYGADLVSCCSDAWREAADCGAGLAWPDHQPPHALRPHLTSAADLARLSMPDPAGGGRMTDRLEAVRAFATQVKGEIPILGWVEGPIAEAVGLFGMTPFMKATRTDLPFTRALMDWTLEMELRFALAQVAAGADMIGIGDAAASLVSPAFYAQEVAPRERRLVDAIHAAGARVRLHICGSIRGKYAAIANVGADLVDVDYPQPMDEVRAGVGADVCLAGNLNPVEQILHGTPEQIRRDFAACHAEAGARYILAAGCEIPPGTPEDNVRAMFDYARGTP